MNEQIFADLGQHFKLTSSQIESVARRLVRPNNWNETKTDNGTAKPINISWRIPSNPKAVILVAQGRAQSAPEWIEFSDHMIDEGYAFVTYDPQGQGKSYRLNANHRHHIDDYMMTEVGDLNSVIDVINRQSNLEGIPKAIIGHSKGGNTALRHMAMSTRDEFQAAVMIAPMTGLQYPSKFLKTISPYVPLIMSCVGHGERYAPSHGDLTLERYLGHKHKISSDPVSQAIQWCLFQQEPDTICHGPTWGFVNEAQKSISHLQSSNDIDGIETPTLWIVGESEQICDNRSMFNLHGRMRNSHLTVYDAAQHQIHMEAPEIKNPMYDKLKRFLKNNL